MAETEAAAGPTLAAGVLLVGPSDRVLLCRRRDSGAWALPGGRIESGESSEEAARREFAEETGTQAPPRLSEWTRRVRDGVDFTTFVGRVDAEFEPTLNEEHDRHTWMSPEGALNTLELHPGVPIALARFTLDELGVAKAMQARELASPQRYGDFLLVALRITGTGASYRPAHDEFVWRDPEAYLTQEFCERCQGLPVLLAHPPKGEMLDSDSWKKQAVGTVALPYLEGDEVWGIAKIYDAKTIRLIESKQISTSPGVETGGTRIPWQDGKHVLVEDKPELLDHVAICEGPGVWDKGGPLSGVAQESTVTSTGDDHMAEKAEEKRDSAEVPDKQGEKLDKILLHLDALHTKHDALHEGHEAMRRRLDALEERVGKREDTAGKKDEACVDKKDSAKKDEGAEETRAEEERKSESKEDKKDARSKKDTESGDDKPGDDRKALQEEREKNKLKENDSGRRRKDAAEGDKEPGSRQHDSAESLSNQLRAAQDQIAALQADIAGKGRDTFVAAQARADRVYAAFGDCAPRWMTSEPLRNYRIRLATPMKARSAAWKNVDISALPEDALGVAEETIYHDAIAASMRADAAPDEGLQEVFEKDRANRTISRFRGHPEACWGQFKLPVRYVRQFNIKQGAAA